jgi:hypothetical protein
MVSKEDCPSVKTYCYFRVCAVRLIGKGKESLRSEGESRGVNVEEMLRGLRLSSQKEG